MGRLRRCRADAGPGMPISGTGSAPRCTRRASAPARTGAMALDLASGRVLFAHNSAVGFVPASNEKLPVTYAALKVLGPTFRFPTEVRGQGSLGADGTWNGQPRAQGLRRSHALDRTPADPRGPRPPARHQAGHGHGDRGRVLLRQAAHRARLEGLVLHRGVAAALRARRRPRLDGQGRTRPLPPTRQRTRSASS